MAGTPHFMTLDSGSLVSIGIHAKRDTLHAGALRRTSAR